MVLHGGTVPLNCCALSIGPPYQCAAGQAPPSSTVSPSTPHILKSRHYQLCRNLGDCDSFELDADTVFVRSGHAPKLGKWYVPRLMRYDSTSALRRFSERMPYLAGRESVGNQAQHTARRLIRQTECHLGPAVPVVAQPEASTQSHACDADESQVARLVELDDFDQATDRH